LPFRQSQVHGPVLFGMKNPFHPMQNYHYN